ncbi:MAG: universal stress protein [Acidobacteriota bacterium]
MHFLVCIGGEQYSLNTLKFGISLSSSLLADLSILYVQPQISYLFKQEVRATREKLESWEIETTELRVIRGVEKILLKEGVLRTVDGKIDVRHPPKAGIHGAFEYHLYGSDGTNVRIRVREGDVVNSIIKENQEVDYDLVVVGAPQDGGRLIRQIIHYIETSVLIVKGFRDITPRLLLCLDDSEAARRAERFAAQAARLLNTSVDILSIYSYPWEEKAVAEVAERARRVLERVHIPSTVRVRRGPVVRTILREAEEDHIVVMGTSERSSLSQFILGSTPVEIGRKGRNPVLVVKNI